MGKTARNGNTDATYRLGKEYLADKLVQLTETIHESAICWGRYSTDNGVPKDEEMVWNCFRIADVFGHPYARYVLERQEQWQRPELLLTMRCLLYPYI